MFGNTFPVRSRNWLRLFMFIMRTTGYTTMMTTEATAVTVTAAPSSTTAN